MKNNKPKFETGNVGVQFIGKPKASNKGDEVLQKMINAPIIDKETNQINPK